MERVSVSFTAIQCKPCETTIEETGRLYLDCTFFAFPSTIYPTYELDIHHLTTKDFTGVFAIMNVQSIINYELIYSFGM